MRSLLRRLTAVVALVVGMGVVAGTAPAAAAPTTHTVASVHSSHAAPADWWF
jgi:hypothetical protein